MSGKSLSGSPKVEIVPLLGEAEHHLVVAIVRLVITDIGARSTRIARVEVAVRGGRRALSYARWGLRFSVAQVLEPA